MDNFKINPRKYVIPQTPRNPVRVMVTGQPSAGKTTLVNAMAEHYGCEIINPEELLMNERETASNDAFEKVL